MQEFNLILYIVLISLFQILVNSIFSFLIERSVQKSSSSVKPKDSKIYSLILSMINSICFLYSLYYLLVFVKTFLMPEFIEIFLSLEPLI